MLLALAAGAAGSAEAQTFPREHYRIVARHSGKCLDVAYEATGNSEPVVQFTCHGGWNQQWRIEPVGSSRFRLIARHSGKALDVGWVSPDNGAAVYQYDYVGQENQQWELVPVGGAYYRIVARHSGKALEVQGGQQADGAQVQQWDYFGGEHQQWRLEQVRQPLGCTHGWPAFFTVDTWQPLITNPWDEIVVARTFSAPVFPGEIRVRLMTPPAVWWWKQIEVLDAENNLISPAVATWDSIRESTMVIPAGYNPSTLKLRFSKAGVGTSPYTVCGLGGLGNGLTFRWVRD